MKVIAALALAARVQAFDNGAPHSRLPALGWSSWVALGPGDEHPIFDYCDENSVKAAADAFMEVGLYDAGYRHLHLDDCWAAKERNATGYAYPEKDHFPNGMKPVVDYVHSKGKDGDNLVFGLYTCGGKETCVGGRVGSEDFWEKDAAVYAEWGVDWVKMDWCNSKPQDPKTTYPKMSKALNASGRAIHFNMCEWGLENPWEWGFDCAQSWRMGGDHTGTWASTKSVIQNVMKIPAQYTGKPYGWNDMDMLEGGNGLQAAHANGKEGTLTLAESITEYTMWAIAASPLVITTPIMNCTAKQASEDWSAKHAVVDTEGSSGERRSTVEGAAAAEVKFGKPPSGPPSPPNPPKHNCKGMLNDIQKVTLLNKEVIAVNQDVTPQGMPVVAGDSTVWARKLTGGAVAVALYNEDDAPKSIGVSFASLGWSATTKATVRDLWAHKDLAPATGMVKNMTVDAHASYLLLLTKSQ